MKTNTDQQTVFRRGFLSTLWWSDQGVALLAMLRSHRSLRSLQGTAVRVCDGLKQRAALLRACGQFVVGSVPRGAVCSLHAHITQNLKCRCKHVGRLVLSPLCFQSPPGTSQFQVWCGTVHKIWDIMGTVYGTLLRETKVYYDVPFAG